MKAYQLKRSDSFHADIDSCSPHGWGSVFCSGCDLILGPKNRFPGISIDMVPKAILPGPDRRPMTMERYREVEQIFNDTFGPERIFSPDTRIGPAEGRVFKSTTMNFAFSNIMLFVEEATVNLLAEHGVALNAYVTDLKHPKTKKERYLEIEVHRKVRMIEEDLPEPCSVCGTKRAKIPKKIRLMKNSFDPSVPIQSLFEVGGTFIINEYFAELLGRLNLTGFVLEECELL